MIRSKIKNSILSLLAIGILSVCLSACGGSSYDKGELESEGIFRFEKVLMETPANQLQGALRNTGYKGTLLNIYPNDPSYMEQVAGFVQDEVIRDTYTKVKAQYDDLGWLEEGLRKGLDKMHRLDDEVAVDKVSTFISGQFDYEMRVMAVENELLIGMDVYVLPEMSEYGYFGNPLYMVNLCKKEYLLADCMTAVARNLVSMPKTNEPQLLDLMIMEGKSLWLTDQSLPDVEDTIKFRYTSRQLDWIKQNESNVWAYLLQEQMLFQTDHGKFHNLTDEAPCTNAFGKDSAPRCAAYIGWRIVDAYMKKTNSSAKELMMETDSQKILRESGYKAK